jgi:hypothetical protein
MGLFRPRTEYELNKQTNKVWQKPYKGAETDSWTNLFGEETVAGKHTGGQMGSTLWWAG